jgi:hypothetical protein
MNEQERKAFAEIAERWAASDLSPVLACHHHLSARVSISCLWCAAGRSR